MAKKREPETSDHPYQAARYRALNHSLELQREYFKLALRIEPASETVRFALARVLKDLGQDEEAARMFDEGIRHANSVWFPRLFAFTGVSVIVALLGWVAGLRSPWLIAPLAALGPLLWLLIHHNRQKSLPSIGYWERENLVESLNMAEEIERFKRALEGQSSPASS